MPNKNIDNKRESHLRDEVKQVLLNPLFSEDLTDERALERWLDDAIRAVKNVASPAKGKELILSLLFYKYLSDLSDVSPLDSKFLVLQPVYRWEVIQNHPADGTLGDFITNITREVTSLTPNFKGILDLVDYGGYQKEERVVSDAVLRKLIEIISCYNLANVTKYIDFWNSTYGYLLQHLPESYDEKRNQFYTPREVVRLMVEIIKPTSNSDFYDPTCGSGCLSGISYHLSGLSNEQKTDKKFVGQDKISVASAIAKMDLYFQDTVKIYKGNTLRNPHLDESGDLPQFKYILANPPWNLSGYDEVFYRGYPERFQYGIPPKRNADWGWIQYILASLKEDDGQAAVILDLGALSRGSGSELPGSERNIRKAIIEQDIIEAVISLPRNLFYNTTEPCCLLLFNVNKIPERKEQILFIDALNAFQYHRSSKQAILKQKDRNTIIEAYEQWKTDENFCRVAPLAEICSYDYDLRPILYVSKEVNIHYRSLDIIEKELVEAGRVRISNDLKILEYFRYPSQESVHLDNILKNYLPGLSKGHLDERLRALLENSEKSRGQELVLEMERREMLSHMLFAPDVEKVPLKGCANIYGGFTPKKIEIEAAELRQEGEYISWVKAGDLEQEYVLETEGRIPEILIRNDIYSRRAVRPVNTIVLAICGGASTVGKTAILGVPAAINQAVCCIDPQEDILDHSYLFCYLTYMRRRWGRDVKGGRQDLTLQSVKKHSIPHLGLEQQREIATKLQPYNEKVRGLKREIALLRQILRA